MIGWRHHGSGRSVDSWICARVLAGPAVACVILDVSALELSGSLGLVARYSVCPGPWSRAAVEPYSKAYHHAALQRVSLRVTLATLRPRQSPGRGAESPPGAGAGSQRPLPAGSCG